MADAAAPSAGTPRDRVDAFVVVNFRFRGTLRLHRVALGWDLLRAPLNVALAPVFLIVRLVSFLARLVGMPRLSHWLVRRRILMRTAVAHEVETRVFDDLLAGHALDDGARRLVADYTGTRSAVAEITTSLMTLGAGAALFRAATPGVVSLAPAVSEFVAYSSAVASFPLGSHLGGLWYGMFPIELPIWFVVLTGIVLAMVASLVTTFAGVLADPIQARLGIHQRRLLRLLAAVEGAEGASPTLPREHIVARLADMTDAGLSLVRLFRS